MTTLVADDQAERLAHIEGAGVTTLAAAPREISARLASAGIDTAALDARLLVRAACGCDDADLIARGDLSLAADAAARLESLVQRRLAREPVAHILGEKEFWGLAFHVGPEVLVPRPDTETLVAEALRALDGREPLEVCDLGTGSAAIVVALLAELPRARGTGVELCPAALAVARRNAERHGLGSRIRFVEADFATFAGGPFDLVVSNPPYVATADIETLAPDVSRYEPRLALDGGIDGLDVFRAIAPRLPALLKREGIALLEVGAGQAGAVKHILAERGLGIGASAHDLSGIERVVRAGAAGGH